MESRTGVKRKEKKRMEQVKLKIKGVEYVTGQKAGKDHPWYAIKFHIETIDGEDFTPYIFLRYVDRRLLGLTPEMFKTDQR